VSIICPRRHQSAARWKHHIVAMTFNRAGRTGVHRSWITSKAQDCGDAGAHPCLQRCYHPVGAKHNLPQATAGSLLIVKALKLKHLSRRISPYQRPARRPTSRGYRWHTHYYCIASQNEDALHGHVPRDGPSASGDGLKIMKRMTGLLPHTSANHLNPTCLRRKLYCTFSRRCESAP
jgi:hypothetical protein